MNANIGVEHYVLVLSRRKWLILGCAAVGLAVGWGIGQVLPKAYRSSTLIMVESQKVPENYVKGVVTGTLQDKLGTIRQLVYSRKLLGVVAREFDLVPSQPNGEFSDEKIDGLRKDIEITTTKDQAFSISFSAESAILAMRVTQRLADLFIQENLQHREELVVGATEFLVGELQSAKVELEAKEKVISEFRQAYMGELPGQMEANLRALDRYQSEMTTRSEELNRLKDRLGAVEKAITEYQLSGTTTAGVVVQGRKSRRSGRVNRIKELEQQLASMTASYKDTYPDVVHLREEIAKLKGQPDEPEEMEENGASSTVVMKKNQDPYLRDLVRQQAELQAEVDYAKERLAKLAAQIKVYDSRVENTPAREQQLMMLVRDYDNMQRNYQSLLDKRLNARIAENLEKKQQGEQFRIIDRANLPDRPYKPDTFRIMMAGLVLGCGLGGGVALLFEQLRRGFQDGDEAEQYLGFPILGVISHFTLAYGSGFSKGAKWVARLLPQTHQESSTEANANTAVLGFGGAKQKLAVGSRGSLEAPATDRQPFGGMVSDQLLEEELNLVVKWRPNSIVTEQYRVAATRLALMSSERKTTVLLVTSAVKGEGKTSTSLNLSYVLAQDLGKTVLLVDCDLKHPRVHAYAGVSDEVGLTNVLTDEISVAACIQQLGNLPLWVLSAGQKRRKAVHLHQFEKLEPLLRSLRGKYDFIVLDCPPIFPLADVSVMMSSADIITLVVRAGDTARDLVKKALSSLHSGSQKTVLLSGVQHIDTPAYIRESYYLPSGAKI